MKTEERQIWTLTPDSKNLNIGRKKGQQLLNKSFKKYGAGRSILLDKNNQIIAGNKSWEAARKAGIENVVVVPTDGKTLIAVQRTDIDINTPEGRNLALADNATASLNLKWDKDRLNEFKESGLISAQNEWSLPLHVWEVINVNGEYVSKYAITTESVHYTPTRTAPPSFSEMYNTEKASELCRGIDSALEKKEITEDEAVFLRAAAARHITFHFAGIAEYYAHASAAMQRLMEESVLVVIDFNDAIDKGLIKLTKDLLENETQ